MGLNAVGKNDSEYKSSPSSELMSIFELSSELPLEKKRLESLCILKIITLVYEKIIIFITK